jgi:antitoxin CptB
MSELSKLKWQCRRGTLELDILLTRYLETCFDCANKDEQAEFISLLKLEDMVLIPYLMGDREPESLARLSLVNRIRGLSPTK